ncbi:uncharacterized protein (DUF2236 family) [Marmoricola sp. URHA0025 HA25]
MTAVPRVDDAEFGIAESIDEVALLLGAGSAVMYQLALLGVGRGVAEHSNTLERPLDRLRTTLTYVYGTLLGTDEERQAIARMVNRAHGPVKGEGYTAFDPELQLWVAATLTFTGEQIYELTFGPMDPASRERAYRESKVMGTLLQVTDDMWPPTRAGFEDYWQRMQGELSADPLVQRYVRKLLAPSWRFWYLAPTIWLQSLVTRGNLTPEVRAVLALEWSPADQRRYDAFWRVFRATYPRVPRPLRTLYPRMVLRGMRKRMREGRRVI